MSVPAVLPPDTSGIPNLHLEELIILNPVDRNLLFGSLSPDSTICQTLQRFCSYDFWTDQDDFKGFDLCRNLNHVLLWARNHSFLYLRISPVSLFLRRASFVCWLVIPISGSDQSRMFDRAREVFQPLKDRRIVLAKAFHDIKRTVYGPSNFWDGQADLWKAATDAVAQNEQLEAVTIVDRMTR
ncbi:hypothetical protein DL96DRAFT_542805 [Flagelloscypha sp. PMI_526]|nr:hypothetical protein DL96DRAFT_542805 [Flagelloscypha sp. PMI_526]